MSIHLEFVEVNLDYPRQKLQVWFADQSRFGQQGSLTHLWAETGTRPARLKQTEYEWLYLYGAICPTTGASFNYLMPECNTDGMNLFLAKFSQEIPLDRHAALILDNAGWHHSRRLKVPGNISLIHLPPYAPELNPIERMWLYLKQHYLSNRVYRNIEALYAAATDAVRRFTAEASLVRSVCRCDYIPSSFLN